jgi:hypothetical protein
LLRVLYASVLAAACLIHARSATAAADLEAAVKATYLYKFAPFITWPADPGASMTICVVGRDPFGDVLDKAVAGQSYNGRPFRIVRLATIARDSECAVAYLAGSRDQSVTAALKLLSGAPILTVTDNSRAQGIIDLVDDNGHVRFRIDQAAAADSSLVVSSKLLTMAISVTPARRP